MRKESRAIFHAVHAIGYEIQFNIGDKCQVAWRSHTATGSNHFSAGARQLREDDRIPALACFPIAKLATELGIETERVLAYLFFVLYAKTDLNLLKSM